MSSDPKIIASDLPDPPVRVGENQDHRDEQLGQ